MVILLLLFEIFSPMTASLQAKRYFKLASEAALQHMLWGNVNNINMSGNSNPVSLTYHNIFVGSCASSKHNCIPKNFPPLYFLTANELCTTKPI